MKRTITIGALLLGRLAARQVASHAPTVAPKPASVLRRCPPPSAVARVNGAVLTDRDLVREMFAIFPYAKQHGGNVPKELEPRHPQGRDGDDHLRGAGVPGSGAAQYGGSGRAPEPCRPTSANNFPRPPNTTVSAERI